MASPLDQDALDAALAEAGYFADEGLVTALYLALELGKPLLLEGDARRRQDRGRQRRWRASSAATASACSATRASTPAAPSTTGTTSASSCTSGSPSAPGRSATAELYAPEFLVEMPLLKALRNAGTAILLIDEIDRADDAFEAFLLEFLSDFQISIPEIGTVRAAAAGGDHPHLQPHPRAARRAAPPLPLPLDRLPRPRPRARDRRAPRPRHRRRGRRPAGRGGGGRPPPAAGQAPGHRRERSTGRAAPWCWSATAPPGPTRCAARSACWSRTRRIASSSARAELV